AIRSTSISVYACEVSIRNIHASVEPAIIAASPPRMEHFIGRQRHPTDVPESEAEAHPTAVSEEPHQRRRPIVPDAHHSRIPAPPETRAPAPAAVMVGSPTPSFAPYPPPAIPIL